MIIIKLAYGLHSQKNAELTKQALQDFVATKLAKYKIPRQILFVDAIPKNAMGKVNKKELIRTFQHSFDNAK